MKGEAPVSEVTAVPGWETPSERAVLKRYANVVPVEGSILEIGSEFGMSASILRKFSFPGVHIVCVEPNKDAPFLQNLEEVNLNFRVHWWQGTSDDFFGCEAASEPGAFGFEGYKFDLIFVDGDHHYAQAKRDIENAFARLKPAGVVILHDVAVMTNKEPHPQHIEVLQAMTEVLEQNPKIKIKEMSDSMVVLHIPQE